MRLFLGSEGELHAPQNLSLLEKIVFNLLRQDSADQSDTILRLKVRTRCLLGLPSAQDSRSDVATTTECGSPDRVTV